MAINSNVKYCQLSCQLISLTIVGMNLSILPIIGISLPLVSYGGSGLIAFFAALGILQNIKKQAS